MSQQVSATREVLLKIKLMMDRNLNIATWNLCLGIANKKNTVTAYLNSYGLPVSVPVDKQSIENVLMHFLNEKDNIFG